MAEQLIESLSAEFEPSKFHDEYREQVLEPDRAQGRRRGDRGPAGGRGARRRARSDGRARGQPGRGAQRDEPESKPRRRRVVEVRATGTATRRAASPAARPRPRLNQAGLRVQGSPGTAPARDRTRGTRCGTHLRSSASGPSTRSVGRAARPHGRRAQRDPSQGRNGPLTLAGTFRRPVCTSVLRPTLLHVPTHRSARGQWPLRPRQRARRLRHRAGGQAVGRGEPRRRREGARRAREPRAPRRRGRGPEHRRRRRHPAADPRRLPAGRGRRRRAAAGRPLRRRRVLPAARPRAARRARAADRGHDRGRGAARDLVARRADRRPPRGRDRAAVGAGHPPGADRGLGRDRRTRTRSSASCT